MTTEYKLPTISVIVPVYKVESYLCQCVDSILSQTFRDFELILVDDGSPDGCPSICDEYAHSDSHIRVVHKENGGVSSARNAGLNAAQGEYIAFVDPDDFIQEDMLQRLLEEIEQSRADMVMCNFDTYFPPEYSGWKRKGSAFFSAVMNQGAFADFMAQPNNWHSCVLWNKLYKRHVWETIRFPEGYIHEDEAVMHRVVERCQSIQIIDDCLYHYRQNISSSIMGQGTRIQSFDKLAAIADRIVCASDNGWQKLSQSAMGNYTYYLLDMISLFPCTEENEKYFRRMDESLRRALPYILKSQSVSLRHKVYLSAIRVNPQIYVTLKRLLKS